jgi:hypothetical protein
MRFVRALGEGGMGVVFLAERTLGDGLTQRVVVKRPRCEEPELPKRAHDRFLDEARALAAIGHGNVVRLLDAGSDAHGPWIALEHVDGVDAHVLLETLRAGDERLTAEELAWIAHEVARGMTAAHALCDDAGEPTPILHRDLSPQNVLLSRLGEVKVTDFGIAWAVDRSTRTTTGVVVGNLRYIAPEQLEGRAVGAVTDVYGVGRVVEELLEVTVGSDVEALRAVAMKATRRDPDERHGSMTALAGAVLEAVPTLARGGAVLARRVEAIARSRSRLTSALAGLLAAERADNDRPSVPAKPPTVEAAVAQVIPAPTVERARSGEVVKPTRRPVVIAATATLLVAGVVLGFQRERPPTQRAGGVVRAVVTPTPVAVPSVTPEVPPRVVPPTPVALPEVPPVVSPTKVPVRRAAREGTRGVTADAAVEAPVVAPAEERATLRVSSLPYAMVSVDDGVAVGVPHDFRLPPGDHRVRARFVNDGDVEVTRTVTLSAGETRRLGLTPP